MFNNFNIGRRFDLNIEDKGYYGSKKAYDTTAFIRHCQHSGKVHLSQIHQSRPVNYIANCDDLFKPVVTDMGICYSFNAIEMSKALRKSKFRTAFLDAFKEELGNVSNHKIHMGEQPGTLLSLNFILDNNANDRPHVQPFTPFRVAITSKTEYHQIRTIAKWARPGQRLDIDVSPMEVKATANLRDIDQSKRGCRFADETGSDSDIFQDYTQTGCQFECMLRKARDFCSCTMWNMPFPDDVNGNVNETICDTYGNTCFDHVLTKPHIDNDCQCPIDCNIIKFGIQSKETPIGIVEQCTVSARDVSTFLMPVKDKLVASDLLNGYYKFPEYIGMSGADRNVSYQDYENLPESQRGLERCTKILKEDIAIVSVNFAANTYVRTIMDRKLSFADKLSSFGKFMYAPLLQCF